MPWSFRVYRGKGTDTPTQLALKLLSQIPRTWQQDFKIGQGTLLGMYRWWVLSLISFLLAHCQFLSSGETTLDWERAAQQARKKLFPEEVFACFLTEVKQMRAVATQLGYEISISPIPVAA